MRSRPTTSLLLLLLLTLLTPRLAAEPPAAPPTRSTDAIITAQVVILPPGYDLATTMTLSAADVSRLPVVLIYDYDPWRGPQIPTFVLYEDGRVIKYVFPSRGVDTFVSTVLHPADRVALTTAMGLELFSKIPAREYLDQSIGEDQPMTYIYLRRGMEVKSIQIYGLDLGRKNIPVGGTEELAVRIVSKAKRFKSSSLSAWFPDRLELAVFNSNDPPGESWPTHIPITPFQPLYFRDRWAVSSSSLSEVARLISRSEMERKSIKFQGRNVQLSWSPLLEGVWELETWIRRTPERLGQRD